MRVIINADDLGLTDAANRGILEAFSRGWITQTTLVVNSPQSEDGARIAFEEGFNDRVGLHLNLSEGCLLTSALYNFSSYSHLTSKGAYELDFTPLFMRSESYGRSPLLTFAKDYDPAAFKLLIMALREEIRAQIERFCDLGFSCRHIDSHRNNLVELPIWLAARPLIKEYGFSSTRPTFDSFATDDPYNEIYRTWLAAERKQANLVTTTYSSSIPRFLKRRDQLIGEQVVELYIHPILKEGKLIDNFTGGHLLSDHISALGPISTATYFDLVASQANS